MVHLDTRHHLIVHAPPPLDLFLVIPIPSIFAVTKKLLCLSVSQISLGVQVSFTPPHLDNTSNNFVRVKWTHLILDGIRIVYSCFLLQGCRCTHAGADRLVGRSRG